MCVCELKFILSVLNHDDFGVFDKEVGKLDSITTMFFWIREESRQCSFGKERSAVMPNPTHSHYTEVKQVGHECYRLT